MTIAAILKHKGHAIITVEATATVPDVSACLTENRIGAVLVMDRADQILGIVSERDIVRSIAANGARTLEMTAGQLMTRAVHLAHPEMTVEEAMRKMTIGRIRHLPVVHNDTVVGMVSIGDIVKSRIMRQDAEVDSMRAYIGGAA
ncbi:MAG: CBS domain-containing protein [Acetobacteraceae bacterium]|nr:CBS domain-containing protein [Acetobacteraceae bacterium]